MKKHADRPTPSHQASGLEADSSAHANPGVLPARLGQPARDSSLDLWAVPAGESSVHSAILVAFALLVLPWFL